MEQAKVGFAFCGSFCTLSMAMTALEQVKARFGDVTPIVSEAAAANDTRFGPAHEFMREMERICDKRVIDSLVKAEPIGPKKLLDVLVIGFGRVGKALSQRLAGLGAKVSVAARKWADLAWAESCGYCGEQTEHLAGWLCGYDLVVNTVTAPVLGLTELSDLKPGCLVIDLASKPGGVDFDAAARLGVKVIWALSLPGKVAPVTAGQCIQTTIYNILRELGV